MTSSPFVRGLVVGSLATFAVGAMILVAGTVTEVGARVCVEGAPSPDGQAVPRVWCGIDAGGVDAVVEVGDDVAGTIIGVELDPGSGATWSLWESLAER
jgi:hypothetical protein